MGLLADTQPLTLMGLRDENGIEGDNSGMFDGHGAAGRVNEWIL